MIKWLRSIDGNKYRFVGPYPNRRVIWKPVLPTEPKVPLKSFVVCFREEEYHAKALTVKAVITGFASDFLSTSPKPKEVEVKELND